MPDHDYYRTLNVHPDATPEEIQKSYRALARRFHPDLNPQPSAAKAMAAINAAYETLGDPSKRSVYDRNKKKDNPALHDAVLSAARDALRRENWAIAHQKDEEIVLKNGSRTAAVALMRTVDSYSARLFARRATGFPVILAASVNGELRMAGETVVVIDLMRSGVVAGAFPDPTYQQLFSRFI